MSLPEIRIFDTLSQQKVPFVPLVDGKVGIYVCGPTVYNFVHIGNARTFTSFDIVVRYLRCRGFEVRYVRNYTDVDDKIIKAAHEAEMEPLLFATNFIREFEKDVTRLRLLRPDVSPRVSEVMPDIILYIENLLSRGVAYEVHGDVYFEVRKFIHYLKLSKKTLDAVCAGAGERELLGKGKRNPVDFALWKAAKMGEPFWHSPWGNGRPGWHIECSVMSSKYLGDTFDIHCGGLDLIFPHHENEIAQSESATGKKLCNYWMHGGFLNLENAKMSKSLGNVVQLRDALETIDPEVLRYYFLTAHYRQQLTFSEKGLTDAIERMEYFYETLQKVDACLEKNAPPQETLLFEPHRFETEFHQSMSDDFNFPGALAAVSGVFNALNQLLDKTPTKDTNLLTKTLVSFRKVISTISKSLGIFEVTPGKWLVEHRSRRAAAKGVDQAMVEVLIEQRNHARAAKDFAQADKIRDKLQNLGVTMRDTPQGTVWKVL